MVVTVWIGILSAVHLATGGVIGATSLPHSWPTEEACKAEAAEAVKEITATRPDLGDVKIVCQIHRKLVDDEK